MPSSDSHANLASLRSDYVDVAGMVLALDDSVAGNLAGVREQIPQQVAIAVDEHETALRQKLAQERSRLDALAATISAAQGELASASWDSPAWDLVRQGSNAPLTSAPCDLLRVGSVSSAVAGDLPLMLPNPARSGVSIRGNHDTAVALVEALLTRMLAVTDRVKVHVIDPHSSGGSLARFGVADTSKEGLFAPTSVTHQQIRSTLDDLASRAREVSASFLREVGATLLDYNAATTTPEVVHVVVALDMETYAGDELASLERLARVERTGIFLIRHIGEVDVANVALRPHLESAAHVRLDAQGGGTLSTFLPVRGIEAPDTPLLQSVVSWAEARKRSLVSKVSLLDLLPGRWEEPSDHLVATVGSAGTTPFSLHLGVVGIHKPHVLIGGESGSGKSTLLHDVVLSLAERYSPDDLHLYLVDGKQGVEMAAYAPHRLTGAFLPHVKVAAIESDLRMYLSVLEHLGEEVKRRAKVCKQHGVSDVFSLRQEAGIRLPRLVAVMDEFQVLLEASPLQGVARGLMETIARQGRSYGIHMILATQTLSGLDTLGKNAALFEQIRNRVALSCTEPSSQMILGSGNKAAATLTQKGEAIFNDTDQVINNQRFRAALVTAAERNERIGVLLQRARETTRVTEPFVFSGGTTTPFLGPVMNDLMDGVALAPAVPLGTSVTLDGPLVFDLPREERRNLAVIGREDATGVVLSAAVALAFHHSETRFAVVLPRRGEAREAAEMLARTLQGAGREVVAVETGQTAQFFKDLATDLATVSGPLATTDLVSDGHGLVVVVPDGRVLPGEGLKAILPKGSQHGLQVVAQFPNAATLHRSQASTPFVTSAAVESFGGVVLTSLEEGDLKSSGPFGQAVLTHPNDDEGRCTLVSSVDGLQMVFVPADVPTPDEWTRIGAALREKAGK